VTRYQTLRHNTLTACLVLTASCLAAAARAQAVSPARWADHSALTTAKGRVEVGVFNQSSYGVTDRLELRTHPLWVFVLPQVHAKRRWFDGDTWHISSSHGLLYPTLFLDLVAKEGTLGLLPATTDIPQALLLQNAALLTARLGYDQWLTLEGGATVGPRTHDSLLLDFPFLYSRFAALNAPIVPHAAVGALGASVSNLDYALYTKFSWLPLGDVSNAYSWETSAELGWSFSDELRLSLSARAEYARFPVGTHWYWFPLGDVQMAW
jgi:hypothetical protein